MTFKTEPVACPFCKQTQVQAELDQGNNLILACTDKKCGMRIPADALVKELAAQHARESNAGAEVTSFPHRLT